MSRRYKHKKNKQGQGVNIFITATFLFVLTPAVPLTFLFLLLFYLLKIKGKYIVIASLALFVFIALFFSPVVRTFTTEFLTSFGRLTGQIVQGGNLASVFMLPFFSFSSWLVIALLSLLLAGYFLSCMNKNQAKEKAGLKTLNQAVEKIAKGQETTKTKEQKQEQGASTYIGLNKSKRKVYIQDNEKHVFVAGTTGSGKTVLLSNFILSACMKKYGLLIVDGKGDTGEGSLLEIAKKFCAGYNRKLYIINMNEPSKSAKYNPFNSTNATVVKDMLINMTNWSEEHYKVNTERYIQLLARLLILNSQKLSFDLIIDYLQTDRIIELLKRLVEDNKISKDEHLKYKAIFDKGIKIIEGAAARFATLQESEIGQIFDSEGVDIYQALKEKAIILFILNPLLYPETSGALGRLILIDAKKAVSKMFNSKSRKFFILDEFNAYCSSVAVDLINKSRSASVTCIPAVQSLADLELEGNDKLKVQILENCNNYVVMRQNAFESAEEWARTIGTRETLEMTYKIDELESTHTGSAKNVREFLVHPDEIKSLNDGEAVYMSKGTNKIERIKVNKPF